MLGADEAVLQGTDEADRGAVVAGQRLPVQVLGQQYVGGQGVLDHHD
jgi:hypothetical protein